MKTKLLQGLGFVALGYLLLVALHFIYLELGGTPGVRYYSEARLMQSSELLRMPELRAKSVSNYATMRFEVAQGQAAVEQKYEKIGSLDSTTDKFEEDEKRTRAVIQQHEALIQEEVVNRSADLRQLHLTIGVPPGSFDSIVGALKAIGKSESFQITKTDKTNDFLELKAKRSTLEKARDSLIGLKSQGGKIEELVKLEQEILKLEDQIQGLGVQLGQFDKVNEFCTVRFNLAETHTVKVQSPHLGYLISSLQWASTVYLALLGILVVGLVCVILLLVVIEKSKILRPEAQTVEK